jgi:hypothetical protein
LPITTPVQHDPVRDAQTKHFLVMPILLEVFRQLGWRFHTAGTSKPIKMAINQVFVGNAESGPWPHPRGGRTAKVDGQLGP